MSRIIRVRVISAIALSIIAGLCWGAMAIYRESLETQKQVQAERIEKVKETEGSRYPLFEITSYDEPDPLNMAFTYTIEYRFGFKKEQGFCGSRRVQFYDGRRDFQNPPPRERELSFSWDC